MSRLFLEGILLKEDPVPGLRVLMSSMLGAKLLPELAALSPDVFVCQNMHKDNLDHSIRVCGNMPNTLRLRWAGLFHDLGKARTRRVVDSEVSFIGHEEVGSELAAHRLFVLGYDELFATEVATLIEVSGRLSSYSGEWTDSAVRRLGKQLGPLLEDGLKLVAGDCTSKYESRRIAARKRADDFKKIWDRLVQEEREASRRPPINGNDVMLLLGWEPGRKVREALDFLLEHHEGSDAEVAKKALLEWAESR